MSDQLFSIVRFTGLAVGVPTALPHGLNLANRGLVPDTCVPSVGGMTVVADDTNVTVTRPTTLDPDAVDVLCQSWHTLLRQFGMRDQFQPSALTPQPFVPGYVGASQAARSDFIQALATATTLESSGLGTPITFSTVVDSATLTLAAGTDFGGFLSGRRYELLCAARVQAGAARVNTMWHDLTNGVDIGVESRNYSVDFASSGAGPNIPTMAVIDGTATQTVQIRIGPNAGSGAGGRGIGNGTMVLIRDMGPV